MKERNIDFHPCMVCFPFISIVIPPLHFHSLFPIPHSSVFMDEKCFIVTENWVVRVISIGF